MNKKILPISDVKSNGNSGSASNPSGNHVGKTQPSTHSTGSSANHRPIGAPEPGAKTALPKINAEAADLAVMTRLALKNLTAANKPPYMFRYGGSLGLNGAMMAPRLYSPSRKIMCVMSWPEPCNGA
jgi:hypothetical protein